MEKIDDEYLYWRGITLEYFEGDEWSDIDTGPIDKKIKVEGNTIYQTIYLEPYSGTYFLVLTNQLISLVIEIYIKKMILHFMQKIFYQTELDTMLYQFYLIRLRKKHHKIHIIFNCQKIFLKI